MNAGRFQSILNGMTSIAIKVFDVVPKGDAWDAYQIHQELVRTGAQRDYRILEGCLKSLVDAGVVIESPRGNFRQVSVHGRAAKPEISMTYANKELRVIVKPAPPAKNQSPIERLSALSARVKACMSELHTIQGDIDTAAIEIEEDMAQHAQSAEKLRQLQALLKGIA